MAGPEPANANNSDGKAVSSATISEVTRSILDDTFYNIIHDIVAKVHRDEKMARMKSAVVLAKQKGEEEAERLSNGSADHQNGVSNGTTENNGRPIRVETEGAVYDDGKVYLKGNPLETTKDIICPNCRLPRLLYPLTGVGARPPPDPNQEYCRKHPPVIMPGHDVHGNRFATDKIYKKKKTQQTPSSNTPASSPPSTPTTPPAHQAKATPEISFPTVKCPRCPRYFQVTRVAQHLDRCMGISGRGANRTKPASADNNGSSTSTAKPSVLKRALTDETDDGDGAVKKKKPSVTKKVSGKKPPQPSKLKNGTTPDLAAAESEASTATTNGALTNGKKKEASGKKPKTKENGKAG